MSHPIPPGTRDILPDEMRELRELQATLTDVFEERGYGQVATPTLEYDEVLAQGEGRGGVGAYRFFDERGELLALRSDMTIPIARLAASRYSDAEPPLRFSYVGNAYRVVRPQRAQMRQFMHAGVELLGAGRARRHRRGDRGAERRPRRGRARTAPSSGSATPTCTASSSTELGVEDEPRERILDRLATHDLVGLEAEVDAVEGLDPAGRETLLRLPGLRGGAERPGPGPRARAARPSSARPSGCRRPTTRWRSAGVADRVQLDLSLLRDLGYYTGAILEVYDPALGHILGGGGRYDDLLGQFGAPMPAAGLQPLRGARAPRPDGGGADRRGAGRRDVVDEPDDRRRRSARGPAGR